MMVQDSELDTFLDGKICPVLEGNGGCIKGDCLAFNKGNLADSKTSFYIALGMGLEEYGILEPSVVYSCNICKWEFSRLMTEDKKRQYIRDHYNKED